MTRKKIRYSEFPLPGSAPAPAPAEAPPVAAAPEPAPAARPRAPLDLARALASARAAEQAAASPSPAAPAAASPAGAPSVVAGRLTPVRGSVAIPRPTPRASAAIARNTPMRGSIAIVRDAVLPAPAPVPAPQAQPASSALREQAKARAGSVELLVFGVGGEWFGVELAAVDEAMDLPAIRHVPEMPPAMLGVITVRGSLTAVYSPASALGISASAGSSALVFKRGRSRLAIAVDEVDDVHSLQLAQLREPPAADAADGLVLGVLRYRDALLALVDAEALIAACQTVPAMETA